LNGITLRSFKMAQPGLTAYISERESKRLVLALDDAKDWKPGSEFSDPDLLVIETGWFEHDPEGHVIVPLGHTIRNVEASFEETLSIIEMINPRKTVLTHISPLWARSYEDYRALEEKYPNNRIQFAYDGFRIKI
jgi:phosphoribosyl 1,2-cyclic phosphate phosphodiesterase